MQDGECRTDGSDPNETVSERLGFRGPDGAGTLGNRTTLRFKGEFGLTAIDNDLFSRPSLLWS